MVYKLTIDWLSEGQLLLPNVPPTKAGDTTVAVVICGSAGIPAVTCCPSK